VGDELQGPCPLCQGDKQKSRSFNVNVAKQIFQCFACKRRGNVLDFTAAMRGTDVHHAALGLRDEFLVNTAVPYRVQEEVSGEGAGEQVPVAEIAHATALASTEAAAEEMPRVESLTKREAWLVDIVATGIAWYLSETFRPFSDVTTIKHCMVHEWRWSRGCLEMAQCLWLARRTRRPPRHKRDMHDGADHNQELALREQPAFFMSGERPRARGRTRHNRACQSGRT
jgi:CHC2 zinc finger